MRFPLVGVRDGAADRELRLWESSLWSPSKRQASHDFATASLRQRWLGPDQGVCERRSLTQAATAAAALQALDRSKPRLVLLDLGLPDRDGLEPIGLFRDKGVPIIVLTAREGSSEKVAALDLGADDHVTKPFDSEELLARIRCCLRRADHSAGITRRVKVGPVEIDLDAHSVRKSGAEAKLTTKEFSLLAELAGHPGKVMTHAHLLCEVWGPGHTDNVEYLRVTVRSQRKELEDDPSSPTLILNEPGFGYRFLEPTPPASPAHAS